MFGPDGGDGPAWMALIKMFKISCLYQRMRSTSGLVAKSNVAIVGPRVRFSAGAFFAHLNDDVGMEC